MTKIEFDRVLESKRRLRERLAALSFTEKLAIVEELRERSLAIATSPLRQRQDHPRNRLKA